MKRSDRIVRTMELEDALEALVELGWCLECLQLTDEEGEPFRAEMRLRLDPLDEAKDIL